jgi:dTDP-4-amino-4,6-dideoxygalactose transaminase
MPTISISKPNITDKEIQAVVEVMKSGMLVQGEKVEELEEQFQKVSNCQGAAAIVNGTAALHVALDAIGIKPGDEVITSPFTFVATANAIIMQGAKVVFADASETDFNIDPATIEQKITDKTKAILVVDLYGQVYDVDRINKIAKDNNLLVVEDACQSVAAEYKGKKVGELADIAVFSLYATKNVMSGEGGMVVSNNSKYIDKAKVFRNHGQNPVERYDYVDFGYNYRMTNLVAAIGVEQIKKLDSFTQKRIANARILGEGLAGIKGLITPQEKPGFKHVYHQYTIRITPQFKSSRSDFLKYLDSKEIGYGIYYPKPLHLYDYFAKMDYKKGDFPVAEKLSAQVISLPVHPGLSRDDLNYMIETIQSYAK